MLELQGSAVEHNCRLVVTGDTKQHHSVQWGEQLSNFSKPLRRPTVAQIFDCCTQLVNSLTMDLGERGLRDDTRL